MIVFFGIIAAVGLLWLGLESAAKHNSVVPSMYRTSGDGWWLVIVGCLGIFCVRFWS